MGPGNLRNIPEDEKVFIDSNILTYNLLNDSVYGCECNNFIKKIEEGRYYGFVSPMVISETLFNVIKAWAFKKHGIRPRDLPRVIKEHREILHDMPLIKHLSFSISFLCYLLVKQRLKNRINLLINIIYLPMMH